MAELRGSRGGRDPGLKRISIIPWHGLKQMPCMDRNDITLPTLDPLISVAVVDVMLSRQRFESSSNRNVSPDSPHSPTVALLLGFGLRDDVIDCLHAEPHSPAAHSKTGICMTDLDSVSGRRSIDGEWLEAMA